MPIRKIWQSFTTTNVSKLPSNKPGVYELGDRGKQIIYIGGSNSCIKTRLRAHFTDVPSARYFRYEISGIPGFDYSGIVKESRHAGKYEREKGRKPQCGTRQPRVK